jgi:5-methylcytosine-specific restriction enzyme A
VAQTFYKKTDRVKFYRSRKWKKLCDEMVKKYHHECVVCFIDRMSGIVIGHIQSIIDRPDLVLDQSNFQPLCCNYRNAKKDFNIRIE